MYTYRTSNTSVSEIRRAQTVSEELLCNLHKAFTVFLLIQISLKAVAIILSNQFIYIYNYYIIFILLCFNVLSTVPRENRLADFLYIYIYIFFFFKLIFLKFIFILFFTFSSRIVILNVLVVDLIYLPQ